MVVAVAHPDDETLAMGATLARLADDGVAVHVVVMSAGEGALDHVGVPVAGLAERRRAELQAATSRLGVIGVDLPGLPDGALAGCHDEMVELVVTAVRRHGARAVLTLWRDDPHPDHRAVADAALAAAWTTDVGVVELGLWSSHWTDPDEVRDQVLLVDAGARAELARSDALARYTSQREPLADGLGAVLPDQVVDWPFEYVLRRPAPPEDVDFEGKYAADHDPWEVATSWYERRKLDVLLAALPREHYRRAWEPGCGPGLVSTPLAGRVGSLVASDGSATALEVARTRPGTPGNVRFVESSLPDVPVDHPVDLLVVSEVLYYVEDLRRTLDVLWSACAPGGHLVLVQWAHRPHDAWRSGPETHALVHQDSRHRGAARLVEHVDEHFLLDVYEVRR